MSERTRLRIVLALSLGLAAVVMLGLPLIYVFMPNPRVQTVSASQMRDRGMYLEADEMGWRLFPRSIALAEAPPDAPVVRAAERVVIVVRQPGRLDEYGISAVGGAAVKATVTAAEEGERTIVSIRPTALSDGTYVVVCPRESMFGGTDYAYFVVSR